MRTGQVPDLPALGSEAQLRAAYAVHGPELYLFALRQLGDEGGAQDVAQEVFPRAWRRADSFEPAVARTPRVPRNAAVRPAHAAAGPRHRPR